MRLLTLSLTLAALGGCAAGSPATPAPSALDPDEYAIYRRVLEGSSQSVAPVFVLATADSAEGGDVPAHLTEDGELLAAFAAAIRVRGIITTTALRAPGARVAVDVGIPGPRTPLGDQEQGWKQLRARYGAHAVFMQFSRVGFTRDRKRAMVIYLSRAGPACNFGVYGAVYQRVRGRWEPIANSMSVC